MQVEVGDKLILKKPHPCKCDVFEVLRVGMDFKIRCTGCDHTVMVSRSKIEKNIKKIIHEGKDQIYVR